MKDNLTMDPDTKFFSALIELQYGLKVENKLRDLAIKVDWAKGWPEDNKAFWNAEAFMWQRKIEKEKREFICTELKEIINVSKSLENSNNLDLGCGAYSYVKSIGFDFSEKMLQFNDNCKEKIIGDLERQLPFNKQQFDSVTAIFVLNYIQNYSQLLKEIVRILNKNGQFVMILSSKNVNDWQRQKEINNYSALKWQKILIEHGFAVKYYRKEALWFFKCKNGD